MRNLILLFTLLVSSFVSAQTFDFSCEEHADSIEILTDSFFTDNDITCTDLGGDGVVKFGDRYYAILSDFVTEITSSTTEDYILDNELNYDIATDLDTFISDLEAGSSCRILLGSIEIGGDDSGKSSRSAKTNFTIDVFSGDAVDVSCGGRLSFTSYAVVKNWLIDNVLGEEIEFTTNEAPWTIEYSSDIIEGEWSDQYGNYFTVVVGDEGDDCPHPSQPGN